MVIARRLCIQRRRAITLEKHLQCELRKSRRSGLQNSPKIRRRDVRNGKAKVCMVRNVERLSAELHVESFSEAEVLHRRQINISKTRSANRVTTFVPKLAGLRLRIEALEGCSADPMVHLMRTMVWIANQIGAARKEAGDRRRRRLERHIGAVVHSEWRGRIGARYSIHLPAVEQDFSETLSLVCEGNLPTCTRNQPVPRVKDRRSMFRFQVKRILRQVILSA